MWGSFKSHLTCWKSYPPSFFPFFFLIIREPGIPKGFALCTLLGGGELEGWKGCTFLSDGIRLPINGVGEERGGLGKKSLIFQVEIDAVIRCEVEKGVSLFEHVLFGPPLISSPGR